MVARRADFLHHSVAESNDTRGCIAMESAREFTPTGMADAVPYSIERLDPPIRRPDAVVLQVDGTVSGIDGLSWLASRRDVAVGQQLAALQREAAAHRWGWAELTRARLKQLRPRRAEINELGAAYLGSLTAGAADAVRALRRAGIAVSLASDVAAEALFGVATALGVSPNELRAPRLRFDAIGAYVGCDLNAARADEEVPGTPLSVGTFRTMFVGTRRSAVFAPRGTDEFIAFSGVIAREGGSDAVATVATFDDLTRLVLR
jgi:hypothetical protein